MILQNKIIKHFAQKTYQPSLTIGIEHEFFLFDKRNNPVTHELSQNFIRSLNGFPQLTISTDSYFGHYTECAMDLTGNTIKYDHHPFLFEIATAPANTIYELGVYLKNCFSSIYSAANLLNLKISFDPILHIATDDGRTSSEMAFRKNLVNYRCKLFNLQNRGVDKKLINYAAGIISTQIHIGGVPFSEYDRVFPILYLREKEIINWSKTHFVSHLPPDQVIRHRETVYTEMFKNYPLVCFPTFNWSVSNWITALFATPLFGTNDEYFAGYTLNDCPELKSIDEVDFLYRVRDLQWIKPHRQGTIEFRSIPALNNIESIMELCMIRLETVRHIMNNA